MWLHLPKKKKRNHVAAHVLPSPHKWQRLCMVAQVIPFLRASETIIKMMQYQAIKCVRSPRLFKIHVNLSFRKFMKEILYEKFMKEISK